MRGLRRRTVGSFIAASAWCRIAPAQTPRPLRVVASFSILADMVRRVAGPVARVSELVGPNADAHVFEPSPTDARQVAEADLIIVNGLHFEGWLERLIQASGYRRRVAVASDGIRPRELGSGEDPHAWQDLRNARRYVGNIALALTRARPAEEAALRQRAEQYLAEIDALDRDVRASFATIPRGRRRVMTSHDAFGYFGAAYGIDFLAPQGMSTDSDPSAANVARLADQIRRQDIRAIFIENISDPRLVERVAKEGGATVGGKLYSDALSPPGTVADSYLKLFAHNAATIAAGLRGERSPPAKSSDRSR